MKCDNCLKEGATKRGNLVLCDDCAKLKLVQDAAPELLEALKNMMIFDTPIARLKLRSMYSEETCASARAAIAKAEGGQQ